MSRGAHRKGLRVESCSLPLDSEMFGSFGTSFARFAEFASDTSMESAGILPFCIPLRLGEYLLLALVTERICLGPTVRVKGDESGSVLCNGTEQHSINIVWKPSATFSCSQVRRLPINTPTTSKSPPHSPPYQQSSRAMCDSHLRPFLPPRSHPQSSPFRTWRRYHRRAST
jgi:hypothetical protein